MKGLLNYLVSALVDHPEAISIREAAGRENVAYVVSVHGDDMGKVIGRGGRIANAIRVLLRAAGGLHGSSVWVDFNRLNGR